MCVLLSYLLFYVYIVVILVVLCVLLSYLFYVCTVIILVVLCVYCCHTCCSICVLLSYLLFYVCIVVILVVLCAYCFCTCTMYVLLYLLNYVCIAGVTLDAELLARSRYSEGPTTGHLDTGFSWFPCVYEQMLRWLPRFQVATICFSCSSPDLNLNLSVTSLIFCLHVQ